MAGCVQCKSGIAGSFSGEAAQALARDGVQSLLWADRQAGRHRGRQRTWSPSCLARSQCSSSRALSASASSAAAVDCSPTHRSCYLQLQQHGSPRQAHELISDVDQQQRMAKQWHVFIVHMHAGLLHLLTLGGAEGLNLLALLHRGALRGLRGGRGGRCGSQIWQRSSGPQRCACIGTTADGAHAGLMKDDDDCSGPAGVGGSKRAKVGTHSCWEGCQYLRTFPTDNQLPNALKWPAKRLCSLATVLFRAPPASTVVGWSAEQRQPASPAVSHTARVGQHGASLHQPANRWWGGSSWCHPEAQMEGSDYFGQGRSILWSWNQWA